MCAYIQCKFNTNLWGFQDTPVAHTHTSFYFLENPGSQSFSSSDEKVGSRGASVSAHVALNLGYLHPGFGLLIPFLPN